MTRSELSSRIESLANQSEASHPVIAGILLVAAATTLAGTEDILGRLILPFSIAQVDAQRQKLNQESN